jgi:hypothetical protein
MDEQKTPIYCALNCAKAVAVSKPGLKVRRHNGAGSIGLKKKENWGHQSVTDRHGRRIVNRLSTGIGKITNGRKRAVGGAKRATDDFIPTRWV